MCKPGVTKLVNSSVLTQITNCDNDAYELCETISTHMGKRVFYLRRLHREACSQTLILKDVPVCACQAVSETV